MSIYIIIQTDLLHNVIKKERKVEKKQKTDADIIEKLDSVDSKMGYLKNLSEKISKTQKKIRAYNPGLRLLTN